MIRILRRLIQRNKIFGVIVAGAYVAARAAFGRRVVLVRVTVALLFIPIALVTSHFMQRSPYSVADLGILPGRYDEMRAMGLNNRGEVAGYASRAGYPQRAFYWRGGRLQDLGNDAEQSSCAVAVNDAGSVPGTCTTSDHRSYAVLWRSGRRTYVTRPSGRQSPAKCINNRDQVGVCLYEKEPFVTSAYLWQSGRSVRIGDFNPSALNDAGDIAGFQYRYAGDTLTAMLYSQATRRSTVLPGLGGSQAFPAKFGPHGLIVGWASQSQGRETMRAVAWRDGRVERLDNGSNASWATGMNSAGVVVGGYRSKGISHACLWRRSRIVDLNPMIPAGSGWRLEDSTGINDAGQIIGVGVHRGKRRSFLLTPAKR